MLQKDYILEVVGEFVSGISEALGLAVRGERDGLARVEQEIGDLLDLDAETALALSPDSLVTMMLLSGMGDSVASYVCYALERLSMLYGREGDEDRSGLRRLQAQAVAQAFDCDPAEVPPELADLDAELFS